MSVVLLGIDKPKDQCKSCDLYEYNPYDNEGVCCPKLAEVDPFSLDCNCPMRQLPDTHGSLIDKDELLRRIEESGNFLSPAIRAYIETAKVIIEPEVNNEQRTKYAICRPYDGITINTEVEFLLDHNGDVRLFDSESAAWEYLKPFGITEEELNVIKVVEYKEEDC